MVGDTPDNLHSHSVVIRLQIYIIGIYDYTRCGADDYVDCIF